MTNNTALDGAPTLLAEQAINNVSTQEQLDSAQKNLLKALDSLTSNPSIFLGFLYIGNKDLGGKN